MNAREYLQQIRRLDVLIEIDLNELEENRYFQSELSRYGGDPSRLDRHRKYFRACLKKHTGAKEKIIKQIEQMPEKHRALLYKRYVEGKTLEALAEEMFYSFGYVAKLQEKALTAFEAAHGEALSGVGGEMP